MKRHALIGVTLDTFDGFTPSILLGALKLLKLEYVEINKTVFQEINSFYPKLGKIKTGFHLPIISESGWDLSCESRTAEINQLVENLNRYKSRLNLHHAVFHPLEFDNEDTALKISKAVLFDNLKKLDLPLYLENVPKYSIEKFKDFYSEAQNILGTQLAGICYDAPHLFITGNDLELFYHNMNHKIGAIHLSDCEQTKDKHMPFGKGVLPVDKVLNMIYKSKFNGFITLEILPHSLQDLDGYINSYLITLRRFNYLKYIKTRIRLVILRPLLKKITN